jgi:hypothetical protein
MYSLFEANENMNQASKFLCKKQLAEQAKGRSDISSDGADGELILSDCKSTCSWTFNSVKDNVKTTTTLEYPVVPKNSIGRAP